MEKPHKLKALVIVLLCAIAIVLLYFYVSSGEKAKDFTDNNSNSIQNSKGKLTKDIDSIIFTFGIKKEWLKDISTKGKDSKKTDVLLISKEVLMPVDLSVIDLNYEISNYLENNNLSANVTEEPKTKNVTMNIFSLKDSARQFIGNLKFVYSDTVKRNASEVCIVLDSIDSYPLTDIENILGSSQEFSVFLPLRNDKADYQSKIMNSGKDYLLGFLIGNDDDVTADFKSDQKENVWKSKVLSIALSFSQTGGVILKSETGLSEFENNVRNEFIKNNINTYPDTLFMQYKRSNEKVSSLLEDIVLKSNSGKKFLFYSVNFTPDEFRNYDKQIYTLKKLGYKFYSFKDIMKLKVKG